MRVHYWELSNYNSGNLVGKWFDIETWTTRDSHNEELQEWLATLTDPNDGRQCEEWILGDVEDIPDCFHSEYGLEDSLWSTLEFLDNRSYYTIEMLVAYVEYSGADDFDDFEDAYEGEYSSLEDYAAEHFFEIYYDIPEHIHSYIDTDAWARDLGYEGWGEVDGYIFRPV